MRSAIIPKPFADYQLFFGKDNYGGARGGVNAWVSSMDYWTRKFNPQEVENVYSYFEPMIHTENNEYPVFSPSNWRQFAVEGTGQCYDKEMTLNEMTIWTRQQEKESRSERSTCFDKIDDCDLAPDHPTCLPEIELLEEKIVELEPNEEDLAVLEEVEPEITIVEPEVMIQPPIEPV